MPQIIMKKIGGLNTYLNPLMSQEGNLIHAVNVDSYPYGAKAKRRGCGTFLGTADGNIPNKMYQWIKNDGITNYLYRSSGSKLYYYNEGAGTGDWTVCAGGTIANGATTDFAVLNDTLFMADGTSNLKYTTTGTSFATATASPIAVSIAQYSNRIYVAGTASTLFYSSANDGTNWSTSGTSDSSSLNVPGAGKMSKIFVQSDKLVITKNSGQILRWDTYSMVDPASMMGFTSPASVSQIENYYMGLNRYGIYAYQIGNSQLVSNPVQNVLYNNSGSAIAGTVFDNAQGGFHRFDYFLSIGTTTDDFTSETINDCVLKYDYQRNEFVTHKYNVYPRSWLSYKDNTGVQQLIYGGAGGQCYKILDNIYHDNGSAIEVKMILLFQTDKPHLDKHWKKIWTFFNPGNEAILSVAFTNTYIKENLKWINLGDCSAGTNEFFLPNNSRSKFMYVKISETSLTSRLIFYGLNIDFEYYKE